MTLSDWTAVLNLAVIVLTPVGVFVGRNYLQARIVRSVQHGFDQKLEVIRADLRSSEERLKSDLRAKESEISALRDGALSGRTQRQALVDKRRLEAAEKVWHRVAVGLAPYEATAAWMVSLNLQVVEKRIKSEPKLQEMFKMFIANISDDELKINNISGEQLFVPPIVWAYFSAYQMVLLTKYAQAKMLSFGEGGTEQFVNYDSINKALKAALPHMSEYIDKNPSIAGYYLLDALKESIMRELRAMLNGTESDQQAIAQSASIMVAVKASAKAGDSRRQEEIADAAGISIQSGSAA